MTVTASPATGLASLPVIAARSLRLHGAIDAGVPHGVVQEYGDLVRILRRRRIEMGLTMMELDARAGWAEGHAAKLENWQKKWGRGSGPMVLPVWLQALDMVMVLAERTPARDASPRRRIEQMELPLHGGGMNAPLLFTRSLALAG